MVAQRGDVWWADLPEPVGSGPGIRRPLLVVQADAFNRSRLSTVVAIALTTNLRLVGAPGNVLVSGRVSSLLKNSVAVVSQLVTLDRDYLVERTGHLPPRVMAEVDAGLKLLLGLS